MSNIARELWRVVEPFHQVAYRSTEASDAYGALGLAPGPHQYFANRLAALGPVGPITASAVLYGFNPAYVGSAVPDVWSIAAPHAVCNAREKAARRCLTRILPHLAAGEPIRRLADLARRMVLALDYAASPLAAANLDRPYPQDGVGALWHSCTVLREHRGDTHWRVTAAHGIDPVECHILHAADGAMPEDLLQRVSGWDDAAWSEAKQRLATRGLVDASGGKVRLTHDGTVTKRAIEAATDAHADKAIEAVGTTRAAAMREEMRPWIDKIMDADVIGAWKMREALWRDE